MQHRHQHVPKELDKVRLRRDIRSEGLFAGDEGIVVMVYGNPPKDIDIEFRDAQGKIKLVLLPLSWVSAVEPQKD
ncbi:MAG TPA: DUF4926 domain-containing protein [Candidatus Nanoarchaeia archaeon]|nr:DUF4926 domain-containing protein [Candidatus Nanoarchaeia archaeon]